jgi:hypothetical protein
VCQVSDWDPVSYLSRIDMILVIRARMRFGQNAKIRYIGFWHSTTMTAVYLVASLLSTPKWTGCGGHSQRECTQYYSLYCDNGRGVHLGDKMGPLTQWHGEKRLIKGGEEFFELVVTKNICLFV